MLMKLLSIVIFFFFMPTLKAQDLDKFQWKNRIILIITENEGSDLLSEQLKQYEGKKKEFKDRKIKVFQVTPSRYRELIPRKKEWVQAQRSIYELKKSESDFEILLVGLDGTVKMRQTEISETEKIFDLIDSMPMRKAEMQNNN